MLFASFNNNKTGDTNRAGTANTTKTPKCTP